jgi:hypothetical protein
MRTVGLAFAIVLGFATNVATQAVDVPADAYALMLALREGRGIHRTSNGDHVYRDRVYLLRSLRRSDGRN